MYASSVPALSAYYTQEAQPNVSPKYHFLSTAHIAEHIKEHGYEVINYQQKRSYKVDRQPFAKHLVRLRKIGQVAKQDIFPEILLINSHNRSSALRFMLGFYRMVCANGLITGDTFDEFKVTHKQSNPMEKVLEKVDSIYNYAESKLDVIEDMRSTTLSLMDRNNFINQAIQLTPGRSYSHPGQLNFWNRYEDQGDSLWHTFNRVQENLMKGEATITGKNGNLRKARKITSLDQNIRLNVKLWNLAEAFIKHRSHPVVANDTYALEAA
jgi:hypothetical protein